jgi:hypothetical protein
VVIQDILEFQASAAIQDIVVEVVIVDILAFPAIVDIKA